MGSLRSRNANLWGALLLVGCGAGPEAKALFARTSEDTEVWVQLATPDAKPGWRYAIARPPERGTASIEGDRLLYVPAPDAFGMDAVGYTITAPGGATSDVAPVNIAIAAVPDAPVATPLSVSARPAMPTRMTLAATDADGSTRFTYTLVSAPEHGQAQLLDDDGTVEYTAEASYSGGDTFAYVATDRSGLVSAEAKVTITVGGANSSPVAQATQATGEEDTPVVIPLLATDPDGDPLTFTIVAAPAAGTATVQGDTVTYVPAPDWHGSDAFSWVATDGLGTSAELATPIVITPVNDAPSSVDSTLDAEYGVRVEHVLPTGDVDGDPLTCALRTAPAHGVVAVSGCVVQYTADPDYEGADSFRWAASDGVLSSPDATVDVTVGPPNRAPTAEPVAGNTPEDVAVGLTLAGSDADGDVLVYRLAMSPTHGSVGIAGDVAIYTPDPDFAGTDVFRYVAEDPAGLVSAAANVTVVVDPVNDAPRPDVVVFTVDENDFVVGELTATDPEGDAITFALASEPRHGTVTLTGPRATYVPTVGYSGHDSFTFEASDGVDAATGTVSVVVVEANAPPTAMPRSVEGTEDEPLTVPLTGYDPDGDRLRYSVTDPPTHGTVTISGRSAIFQPEADWSGRDTFRFVANDGFENSAPALVRIQYAPVDDPPVAEAATITTDEDTAVTFRVTAVDHDGGGAPEFDVTVEPEHGRLFLAGPVATYTPDPEWSGVDTFEFTASDGDVTTAAATITLEVLAVDDVPLALATSGHTPADSAVDLTAVWYDPDSEGVVHVLDEQPAQGVVTETTDGFHYEPPSGWFGADTFYWHAEVDGVVGESVPFRVNVHPPPDLDRPDMPQIGVNKVAFALGSDPDDLHSGPEPYWPENIFDDFSLLGVQMYRQASRADLVWSAVQLGSGAFTDGTATSVLSNPDVAPSATLFEIQYASPTPPWWGADDTFTKTMGEEAYAYLDHVIGEYSGWVRSYEIGNEMFHWVAADPDGREAADLPECYPEDGYTPQEQAVFVEEASRYVRAAEPDAVITLASINTGGSDAEDWIRGVLEGAGDDDWFDVVSYHSYDTWRRAYNTRVALSALLDELGLEDRLIRLTEAGSTSDEDYTDRTDYPNSDETQCSDVFRLSLIGWSAGDATVLWHTYLPISESGEGDFRGFELVESDGTWKPSAYSYQLLTESLLPMRQITELASPEDQYVYEVITTDDEIRYVAWGAYAWVVPAGVTEYTSVYPDADGSFTWVTVAEGDEIELTETPVLAR